MNFIFANSIALLSVFSTAGQRSTGGMILGPISQELTVAANNFEMDRYRFVQRRGDWAVANRINRSVPASYPEGTRLKEAWRAIDLSPSISVKLLHNRQTLYQSEITQGISRVTIIDNPRFSHQNVQFDILQHFFPVGILFRCLDETEREECNKFHSSPANNSDWHIQPDVHPVLIRLKLFHTKPDRIDWQHYGERHYILKSTSGAYGNYYTEERLRSIVTCAAGCCLKEIPEIGLHVHSSVILTVYPEGSCSDRTYGSGKFCVNNPQSLQFKADMLPGNQKQYSREYIPFDGNKPLWRIPYLSQESEGIDKQLGSMLSPHRPLVSYQARILQKQSGRGTSLRRICIQIPLILADKIAEVLLSDDISASHHALPEIKKRRMILVAEKYFTERRSMPNSPNPITGSPLYNRAFCLEDNMITGAESVSSSKATGSIT
ncbi:family 20 glycosylhydrolase [Alistipes sp.]|uniref:family 20 glycosylhydrolase n=1 Tax=Alistipes sp. TaxID=1872444 RepID=UPI0025BE718B|nr:family 20 glycosylhydrolase [Alistipes sp.]